MADFFPCQNSLKFAVSDVLAFSASYYCVVGANTPTPQDNPTGGICPPEHYCPAGTGVPVHCPPGTFSNKTGNPSVDACQPALGAYNGVLHSWFAAIENSVICLRNAPP